ncbi:hypothetical protein ABG775_13140 [Peribacillus simplex]|uniref:hypothetical protein n=2 Tax=Bacillaceae TaxID=186817 RepID=UPI00177F20BF|nr:hypothetical protein [Brevibacillus sp. JNUCC-41]QOS89285.1 hypothetical protein JNUCC41_21400 [Brevibacillus sp. JNUCC-41]
MNIGTYAELISKAPLNKEKEAKRQETRDVNWFKSIIRQRGKKHIKEVWAFSYGLSLNELSIFLSKTLSPII